MRLLALGLAAALLAANHPAPASAGTWEGFQVIMWHDRTPAQMAGLRRLGFTATKLFGTGGRIDPAELERRVQSGLPWYLENIGTDFYAPYHRYAPGKSVTWLFDAAKARRRADPGDAGVFVRDPSLSDPAWLAAIQARLADIVARQAPHHPLYYNLADEAGIGDLAAAWDADIAAASLDGMRQWLRTQYPSLDALNRQWGSAFPAWDAVVPELTDAAMRRTDENYSAWADFKAWMDVAFARALRTGTDAVHRADPAALAALEGGQLPGWGGYDYGLLAGAVDVMEIYDAGNALDLARAFNPALIPLRTSFGAGPRETHAAWRHLIHGGRGMVVWDEADDVVAADGAPGPRGAQIAALLAELGPAAPTLIASTPAPDPVAVLYSQASFRTRWMLDHRALGARWSDRDAEREYDDNAWRAARRQVLQRLAELGVQPRLVTSAMLETGALAGARVLILPHAIALSDAETATIEAFAARGGTVLADTEPGLFDQHSRRRTAPVLEGVASLLNAIRPDGPSGPGSLAALTAALRQAGAAPRAELRGPDGQPAVGIDAQWLRHGNDRILALQTLVPWGAPAEIEVRLAVPAWMHDLRRPGPPQRGDRFHIHLDPIAPTILVLTPG